MGMNVLRILRRQIEFSIFLWLSNVANARSLFAILDSQ